MGVRFDNIPSELMGRDNWLLWRAEKARKVPYQPHQPAHRAKSTNPMTWGSYDATKAAYRPHRDAGVGFVLDGGGYAAIDIDGDTSKRAVDLLHDAGCGYIEYSPSGNGLHGWGYHHGELPRKKGVFDGINVEIYNTGRYMSVTGNAICATALASLDSLTELSRNLADVTQDTQEAQDTQETQVRVLLEAALLERFIPAHEGQRNSQLFQLARHLKAKYPDAGKKDLRAVVKQWHGLALPNIRTKDFYESWGDFARGWKSVKFPEGQMLDVLLADVDQDPIPAGVPDDVGDRAILLTKICRRLQDNAGDDPFFLAARKAGELLGCSHMQASRLFNALMADGVLALVEKGSKKTGNASCYEFIANEVNLGG